MGSCEAVQHFASCYNFHGTIYIYVIILLLSLFLHYTIILIMMIAIIVVFMIMIYYLYYLNYLLYINLTRYVSSLKAVAYYAVIGWSTYFIDHGQVASTTLEARRRKEKRIFDPSDPFLLGAFITIYPIIMGYFYPYIMGYIYLYVYICIYIYVYIVGYIYIPICPNYLHLDTFIIIYHHFSRSPGGSYMWFTRQGELQAVADAQASRRALRFFFECCY